MAEMDLKHILNTFSDGFTFMRIDQSNTAFFESCFARSSSIDAVSSFHDVIDNLQLPTTRSENFSTTDKMRPHFLHIILRYFLRARYIQSFYVSDRHGDTARNGSFLVPLYRRYA